ncbi:flavodoxin family protein [Clostridioides sp. ZZV14-6153]|nr:flavodoxin family protein [Clostridioides sp. ZZV14-6153]
MIKKNIVAIIGSNNNRSQTKAITENILNELTKLDQAYSYKGIFLGELNLKYCIGCQKCFNDGFCELDKLDDMVLIREYMEKADIILLASPVYANDVSGIMKTFIDRISYQFHLLSFSGKLGFTLTVADHSGSEKVIEYLDHLSIHLGIKNLSNYSFIYINDSMYEKPTLIAKDMLRKIQGNYGYSNYYLEYLFRMYKFETLPKDAVNFENVSHQNELKFWSQNWIKNTDSFQEFAAKKRSINYDLYEK